MRETYKEKSTRLLKSFVEKRFGVAREDIKIRATALEKKAGELTFIRGIMVFEVPGGNVKELLLALAQDKTTGDYEIIEYNLQDSFVWNLEKYRKKFKKYICE